MPYVLYMLIVFFGLLFSIVGFIICIHIYNTRWCFLILIIPMTLVSWSYYYSEQEWRISHTEQKNVFTVEGVQYIKVLDDLINVNETLKRYFPEGSQITIHHYDPGPYAGIMADQMHNKMYKLEVSK